MLANNAQMSNKAFVKAVNSEDQFMIWLKNWRKTLAIFIILTFIYYIFIKANVFGQEYVLVQCGTEKIIFCTESKSSGAIHDEKPLILELKLESSLCYNLCAFNLLNLNTFGSSSLSQRSMWISNIFLFISQYVQTSCHPMRQKN